MMRCPEQKLPSSVSGKFLRSDQCSNGVQARNEGSFAACSSAPPPQPPADGKPLHDVMAGAMARAASQGTIHPLDTLKVQMQVGQRGQRIGE